MKIQMTAISFGVFLATTLSVFAGEGAGYNGPVTAGESIPVQLDRAVSLEGLTRTYQVCTSRLAKDVARQVVKMTPADFDAIYTVHESTVSPASWSIRATEADFEVQFGFYTGRVFSPKSLTSSLSSVAFEFPVSSISHTSCTAWGTCVGANAVSPELSIASNMGRRPTSTRFQNFDLPLALFSNTLNEAKYDELGNLDQSTVILSGLILKIPPTYQDQIPLINQQSGMPSAIRANLKGFVDCFYNEIQK